MTTHIDQSNVSSVGPAMQKMLAAFPDAKEKSNGWWFHPDNPTFDFREGEHGEIYIWSWTNKSDEQILASRGLKPSDITSGQRGYFMPKVRDSLDLLELAQAKGIHWHVLESFGLRDGYKYHGYNCIKIPYYNADGSQHTKIKVRRAISGKGAFKQCWDESTPGEIPAYGLDKLWMARQAGYLLAGEGESDGWANWLHNIPYLGVPGATLQKTLQGVDLNDIPRIYILDEPDQMQQMLLDGQGFYKNVHKTLRANGYTGEIYCIDFKKATGYKDPSELHYHLWREKREAEFEAIMQNARQNAIPANDAEMLPLDMTTLDKAIEDKNLDGVLDAIPLLAQIDTTDYLRYEIKIKKTFGSALNLNTFQSAVSKKRKSLTAAASSSARIDMDYIAQVFKERYSDTWAYDPIRQGWRRFNGTHWQSFLSTQDEKHTLDALFTEILHEHDIDVNSNRTLDCIHRLTMGKCKRAFSPRSKVVNFLNGTLDIATMQLCQHNRDDDLLFCLPYDYAPGAHPTITNFLTSTLQSEFGDGEFRPDPYAVVAYVAHVGLALIGDTRLHYALYIKGPGGSGKSTKLDLANLTCGVTRSPLEKKYASDDIFSSELEGKRARYEWYTERIVCVDELPTDALQEEQTYKRMTAHGGVGIRGIGRDETKDNQWTPKLLITCNEAPAFKDMANAIKRRNIYIQTPRALTEGERNLNLIDDMSKELGAFAHTCILVALEVLKRGYYPQSGAMRAYAARVNANGNPLRTFIEDHCALGTDKDTGKSLRIGTSELFEAYRAYCERSGYKYPLAINSFTTAIKDMNIGVTQPKGAVKDPTTGKKKRVLLNIDLLPEDEIIELPEMEDDAPLSGGYGLTPKSNSETTHLEKVCSHDSNGSTSQPSVLENGTGYRVTDFSNTAYKRDTHPIDNKGRGVSYKENSGQKSVTLYPDGVTPPVESFHESDSFEQVCSQPSEVCSETVATATDPHQILLLQFTRQLMKDTRSEFEWDVPATGLPAGMVPRSKFLTNLRLCMDSSNPECIQAAVTVIQNYLKAQGVSA